MSDLTAKSRTTAAEDTTHYRLAFRATPSETRQWGDSSDKSLLTFETSINPNFRIIRINWAGEEKVLRLSLNPDLPEALLQQVTDKQLTITVEGVDYLLGHYATRPEYHQPHYQGSEAQKLGELLKQAGTERRFYCHWHN
ncbi:DUF7823 domain-containing protein [Xenorhabdus bovienii]|uniref:DUF7823 domain-containing protein n=1 Tax=Xenorhabdus bovienii TaxID=40576 RepID=UPI003DA4935C